MSLLDVAASVGLVINDFFAIITVIGSFVLLIEGFARRGRRRKGSDQMALWSIMGLLFGSVCQFALYSTGNVPAEIGFIFRLSPSTINGLLFFSLLLIMARMFIAPRRQRRTA